MQTLNGLPIYELSYDDNFTPTLQLALVDYPAINVNWQKLGKQMRFVANEEQRIIFGPAMVPDFPIYRCDEMGEYYITFSADNIAKVAKGFVVGCHFNLMHDAANPADCTLIESYLLNASEGKTAPDVFGTLPDGTWMVKAHIEDDALWADVKAGIYRGFSVESFFNMSQKMKKVSKLWRRMLCASVVAKHNDEEIALQYVEDEFAEGIAVYVLDETGALVPAPDGEYVIDEKVYVVADGIIKLKPEEEEAPVEEAPIEEAMEGEENAEDAEAPAETPDYEERFAALEVRIAALEEAINALVGVPDAVNEIAENLKKYNKRNCELDKLLESLKEVSAKPIEKQSMRAQETNDRVASMFANRK